MEIIAIIPARFASTRFPAKLLKEIGGKTILQMVYEQCQKTKYLNKVVVATDNEEIFNSAEAFGGEVVMSSIEHKSGTDRCAEILKVYGGKAAYDYVVNIQGDEPTISPETIDKLCLALDHEIEIATVYKKIEKLDSLLSANVVKVISDEKKNALYFSRSPIPHLRDIKVDDWLNHHSFNKHLGIYAFRSDVLEKITRLPQSNLENMEKLEQLRWLSNGFKIKLIETNHESIGIDTPEDFERLKQFLGYK
jgi:3-deoxy-manno-octulosonate cytidylyltransferase (CMP-KDO synthetase)